MVNEQIVNEFMAKTKPVDLFGPISGALTKINKKSPHAADQKMILATHRTAPTTNTNCQRVYIRNIDSVTRTTPVTVREGQNRVRFSTISRAVQARMKDLSKVQADQAAFLAQKDLPNGKTTMLSYLFKLEGDAYDEQHE